MKKTIVLLSMIAFSLYSVDDSILTKRKTPSGQPTQEMGAEGVNSDRFRQQFMHRERVEGIIDGCILGSIVYLAHAGPLEGS